jgi:hypothetical protein
LDDRVAERAEKDWEGVVVRAPGWVVMRCRVCVVGERAWKRTAKGAFGPGLGGR